MQSRGGRGSTSTDPSVLLDQWVAAATNLWAGTSGDSNAMAVKLGLFFSIRIA